MIAEHFDMHYCDLDVIVQKKERRTVYLLLEIQFSTARSDVACARPRFLGSLFVTRWVLAIASGARCMRGIM